MTALGNIPLTEDVYSAAEVDALKLDDLQALILSLGPVAYWTMDETSGQIADLSGNGNDSDQVTGSPVYGIERPIVSKPGNTGIGLNDGHFRVPDDSSLDVGDVFSLLAGVKLATVGETLIVYDKQINGFRLIVASNGEVQLSKATVGDIVASTVAIADKDEHLILVTKNAGAVKVYLDGEDVTGAVSNQTIQDTSSPLLIGTELTASAVTDAMLDELAIFPGVLTPEQASALHRAWRSLGAAGLTFLDHGNTGSTETVDASAADVHRLVLDAATVTLTLTGAAAAGTPTLVRLQLVQDGTGGREVAWPGSVIWASDGTPPTLSSDPDVVDVIDLETDDGGTTWLGLHAGAPGPPGEPGASGGGSIAVIVDQKAAGADGGTFTSGAWRKRDLTTIRTDSDGIVVALTSSEFDLDDGTYKIDAEAPAGLVASHQARLFNVDDSVVEIEGSLEYTPTSAFAITKSRVVGVIVVTGGPKTFRLEHRCITTNATEGFGSARDWGDGTHSIYSQVIIEKKG